MVLQAEGWGFETSSILDVKYIKYAGFDQTEIVKIWEIEKWNWTVLTFQDIQI